MHASLLAAALSPTVPPPPRRHGGAAPCLLAHSCSASMHGTTGRMMMQCRQRQAAAQTVPGWPVAAAVAAAAAAAAGALADQQGAQELPLLLTGVRVVLVSPKTPANIGSVLRLAENFEAHDVVVVDPRCDARCGEVEKTSCDSPVMRSMRVVPSLADALADCTGSIGFTRRAGAGRLVHASLQQLLGRFPTAIPALLTGDQLPQPQASSAAGGAAVAAPATSAAAQLAAGPVALVFGREESGLLESELLLCSHACSIPSGRSQPSLNLSHAVAVVLSQLFDMKQQRLLLAQQRQRRQKQQGQDPGASSDVQQQQQAQEQQQQQQHKSSPTGSLFEDERVRWKREQALQGASQAELEALLQRMAALLEAAGISAEESIGGGNSSNHGRKKKLMGHVRSLLLRSQASTAEVRSLHGLCKELEARQRQQQRQQQQ